MENEAENTKTSLNENIKKLVDDVIAVITGTFTVFMLETRLAVKSMVMIAMLVLLALLLAVSAWFCLLAALAYWLFLGLQNWALAILLTALLNVLLLAGVFLTIKKLSQYLQFRWTKKQMTSKKVTL